MIKSSVLGFVAALACMPAYANQSVTDVRVFHHTKTISTPIQSEQYVCNMVDVPVYTEGEARLGDFLTGAIIGGLLGGTVTDSDKGAAVGAFTGGVIAAENGKKKITGYRQQEVCNREIITVNQSQNVYSHSTIRFFMNGKRYVLTFQR